VRDFTLAGARLPSEQSSGVTPAAGEVFQVFQIAQRVLEKLVDARAPDARGLVRWLAAWAGPGGGFLLILGLLSGSLGHLSHTVARLWAAGKWPVGINAFVFVDKNEK
jgi:hypothetical protein